jgi:hypothetical protein
MTVPPPGLSLRTVTRNALVLAGLLLLGVGLGDSIAGRTKIAQYEELLQTTVDIPAPVDPAALFPTASESHERHELARAKLAFYQLLLTAGQFLSGAGLLLMAIGILRLRFQAGRLAPEPPVPN